MPRLFLALALLFFANTGSTQPITVRSGAHEGFARLVVPVPDGSEWRISEQDRAAILELSGHSTGFDTSRVFELIDRQFIASVTSTPSSLRIAFACDCIASSFVARDAFVVVDVSKRPDATENPATDLVRLRWPESDVRLSFPGAATGEQAPDEIVDTARSNAIDYARQESAPDVLGSLGALVAEESQSETGSLDELAEAQQKLAHRVAVAATQGILAPTVRQIDLPLGKMRAQIDTDVFDSSVPYLADDSDTAQPNSLNLRITSSSDLPTRSVAAELQSTSMGVRCISPDAVAVDTWSTNVPPAQQISEFRAGLFTEFDRLNHDVALDLAKLYLHYGFGAEARQVLSIDADLARKHPALIEMSDIMEYGDARDGDYLRHFADCGNRAALWGILAQARLDPSQPVNADAALRATTALPLHLRRIVAPKLSRRFLEIGDEARAETALRSIDRAPEDATGPADLARAELQMAKGETEAAQQTLSGIVASNEAQSAEALIQFVDSHLAADTLIDGSVATLVEAYAIEMRGHPLGAELKRAHVLALAKSGQFDEAFDALRRLKSRDGTKTERDLRVLLLGIVTRNAPDVVFLERAFDYGRDAQAITNALTNFAMAERSAALGFPQLAELIANKADGLPVSAKSKELLARIALDLERPFEAEEHLFGVETDTANRLRARANSMTQNYETVASIFAQLGEEDRSLRAAWLAGDWSSLDRDETHRFAPVTDLIETQMDTSENLDGMLGRMSEALRESAEAREVIQSLLTNAREADAANEP